MSDSFCWTPQRKILTPAQTGLRALPVFGIRSSTCADRPLVPHSHPGCLEVVFFLSGFQIYETEGHLYSLCGNDVFVVRPGELHSSGDFPESVSRMIWFQLDVTGTEPFLGLDQPSSDELRPALLVLPRLFHANASLGADLAEAFRLLAGHDPLSAGLGRQLFVCCLYRLLQFSRSPALPKTDSIGDAIAYIHDHLGEKISLEDAAASCNLSLSRFKAKFKEETGSTPRTFINYLKMEQAKLLLKQGNSITETALSLDFETPSYFASTFKKYTGLTPARFCKERAQAGARQKSAARPVP